MKTVRGFMGPATFALALVLAVGHEASAQVVEGRESEANPAGVIFRSTLYGVGTGLALGGAYTLVNDDDDAGDILRWGAATGAAAGLLIGLVHIATRSEPEDDQSGAGMLRVDDGNVRVSVDGVLSTRMLRLPDRAFRVVDIRLFGVGF